MDIGITRNESADYQRLASVPEKVLEKIITIVKERDGVLTEAAVKRELPTHRTNPIPQEKKLPDINLFTNQVCFKLNNMLAETGDPQLWEWLQAMASSVDAMHEPAKHSMRHSFRQLIKRVEAWERKFQ